MNGTREGLRAVGAVALVIVAALLLGACYCTEVAACRSKHPDAAPWACWVNP